VSTRKKHPGLPGPKTLDLVDLVLYLLDARIPRTSLQISEPYLLKKKRVYVLTKPDLADPGITQEWVDWFRSGGMPCFAVESNSGKGLPAIMGFIKETKAEIDRRIDSKVIVRPIKTMLFGLPNVGKSSLANRLLGTSKAPFGARPGLTRGSHWLRGRGLLEVLDTPGVIDTSKAKGDTLHKLAATWAVRENQYDEGEVAFWLAREVFKQADPASHIIAFGSSRRLIGPGGGVDLNRACRAFIQSFRDGKIGRVSIEKPGNSQAHLAYR
jgi:ribosome biogenesis GTPase A